MQETRWAQVWMTTGLLWFLLAIAFAPTNKIYQQGLVPPHIAAGINLNFWPAGPIFRRGGAFFIRRSFSHLHQRFTHTKTNFQH